MASAKKNLAAWKGTESILTVEEKSLQKFHIILTASQEEASNGLHT